jgi:hypothetical protein
LSFFFLAASYFLNRHQILIRATALGLKPTSTRPSRQKHREHRVHSPSRTPAPSTIQPTTPINEAGPSNSQAGLHDTLEYQSPYTLQSSLPTHNSREEAEPGDSLHQLWGGPLHAPPLPPPHYNSTPSHLTGPLSVQVPGPAQMTEHSQVQKTESASPFTWAPSPLHLSHQVPSTPTDILGGRNHSQRGGYIYR